MTKDTDILMPDKLAKVMYGRLADSPKSENFSAFNWFVAGATCEAEWSKDGMTMSAGAVAQPVQPPSPEMETAALRDELANAQRLITEMYSILPAEGRQHMETRTGSWFVWGVDRSGDQTYTPLSQSPPKPWWFSMWTEGKPQPNRFDICKLCGESHSSVFNVLEEHSMSHLKVHTNITDLELTKIYDKANKHGEGKLKPITTEKIFAAMRACLGVAQPTPKGPT